MQRAACRAALFRENSRGARGGARRCVRGRARATAFDPVHLHLFGTLEHDDFIFESSSRSILLLEHDLFRKPVPTLGSSPRAGFFGIMLYVTAAGGAWPKEQDYSN